jgi:hypothetical protein
MAKFLVITRLKEPLSDSGHKRLPLRAEYWLKVRDRGAEVYSVVGRKGCAIFIDVESHDELWDVLGTNPMVQDEEVEVYALGTLAGEAATAERAHFERLVNLE